MVRNSGIFWARIRARNADSSRFHSVRSTRCSSSVSYTVECAVKYIFSCRVVYCKSPLCSRHSTADLGRQRPMGSEGNPMIILCTTLKFKGQLGRPLPGRPLPGRPLQGRPLQGRPLRVPSRPHLEAMAVGSVPLHEEAHALI